MSFLAPFYLLAGLAIGLPIYFHFFRRAPQGRQVFGSVMFLSASPPQTTRRSRIQDWLLLLLRSLAILLIAFAFSRPFFASADAVEAVPVISRQFVFVVDHSASMSRETCWEQALNLLSKEIDELNMTDQVAVIAFSDQPELLFSFEDWEALPPAIRKPTVLERLGTLSPDWQGTQAGKALVNACELLSGVDAQEQTVVLISDLAEGSHWDALNQFDWPETITLSLLNVETDATSNAGLQRSPTSDLDSDQVRVRVTNTPQSTEELFTLTWAPLTANGTEDDTDSGQKLNDQILDQVSDNALNEPEPVPSAFVLPHEALSFKVQVPAGETRIVTLQSTPQQRQQPHTITLTGDNILFDNQVTVAMRPQQQLRVIAMDTDSPITGVNNPFYFLEAALPATEKRQVELVTGAVAREWTPNVSHADWVILGRTLSAEQIVAMRAWIQEGHSLLFLARTPEQSQTLFSLLGQPEEEIDESSMSGYQLWQKIDFTHTAFKQFNAPQFSDFSKIAFQRYRVFPTDSIVGLKPIVTFDNGDLALGEITLGQGRIVLMTSTWGRDESDLAVSSKFVPLLNALLEQASPNRFTQLTRQIGESLQLAELSQLASQNPTSGIDEPQEFWVRHAGEIKQVEPAVAYRFLTPGLHEFAVSEADLASGRAVPVIVNLDPQESLTDPLDEAFFEGQNIPIAKQRSKIASAGASHPNQERLLKNAEQESQQRYWQSILWIVMGVLVLESLLATIKRSRIQKATQVSPASSF